MTTTILASPRTTLRADALERLDSHCMPDRATAQLLSHAPWRRLAIVGDSIAEGVGDAVQGYRDLSWAERLRAGLEAAVGAIAHLNLGERGLTAAQIRDTQLPRAAAFRPDLAVVCAGGNDLLGGAFDPHRVEAELEHIVSALADSGALVVTFGLLDLSRVAPLEADQRRALHSAIAMLNAVTAAVTRRHDGVHVDFFRHPALARSLFSADLLHPNRRGHAYIAGDVIRALAARLRPS